ncbi:MAG: MFS transporter [Chlamydiia bacterium]|nr:MFS transporter [Chlamydiia bacterium]
MDKSMRILGIFIYTLTSLFLVFEMALQVSPSVMTRDLMYDFNIGAATLGIMASFYYYSYTLMQIPVGLLYDRFSARWLITCAAFICTIGAFFFAFTHHVAWAAFSRFLMGIGSAFAFVGVLIVAARWFPPHLFAFLVGIAQFLGAMGALCGELPIAWMLDSIPWRVVLVIFGAVGSLLTVLCFMIVRDNPYDDRFIPKRHHLKKELKEIIGSGQTWWLALYAFCSWGPVVVFAALWGVPYLRVRFQVPNTYAAVAMALVWIGVGCMSPFLGWLSDRLGRRCLLLRVSSLIGLFSSLILFYVPWVTFNWSFILLLGIGIAAAGQILTFALVKDNNRSTTTGTAIGLNNMAVVAGGALFQPLVGFLLHLLWKGTKDGYGVPIYSVADYHVGLTIVPVCFFIAFLVSFFFIKETYCRPKFAN